mgnify:CR=1 FL=1
MNKKIKNAFSDVSISEDLERNILNITVNNKLIEDLDYLMFVLS